MMTSPFLSTTTARSALAALVISGATAAHQNPQPPATFRTAVDVVPVDVNIVDRTGRPVTGLSAADFVLTIDDQPRRIASAQYIETARAAAAPAQAAHYSSNAVTAGGRMVMFVVDQGSIGTGRARLVTEAAQRFLASLSPADRVGLTSIPAGPQIDFTANHALVAAALPKLVGQVSGFDSFSRITLAEAAEIQRGSRMAQDLVLARECGTARSQAEAEICARQVLADAVNIYSTARERARTAISALRALVERLAATPAPKTVVFVSEGLFLDREFTDLAWLGPAAARAQVVVYVLQLERPLVDASRAREGTPGNQDRFVDPDGLSLIANLSRGAVLRVVGGADSAFERLALEISGYYLLTFEPQPGDADGKPHRIRIAVPGRGNLEIRARSEFVIGGGGARTVEEVLTETLRAPVLASDIGIQMTTYTLRDPASERLLVLVAADVERPRDGAGGLALAYVALDAKGTVASSQMVKEVSGPVSPDGRTLHFVGSLPTGPGVHTLKLAVVDGRGRRGSVEHTFDATLRQAGSVRTTDLVIAARQDTDTGSVLPSVTAELTGDVLHGYLELYGEAGPPPEDVSVIVEIAADESGPALDSAPARLRASSGRPARQTAEARVPIALLPPGDYVARAVVMVGGARAGQVTRPFRVSRGAAAAVGPASGEAAAAARAGAPPRIAFASRIDAFERQRVLAPDVVGFFVRKLDFGPGGAAAAAATLQHVRDGQLDAAIESLREAGSPPLPIAFLTGLQRLSAGDLEGAAAKFRETLKLDREFFPAAFYLGSCYAAGGRDREAVGAWQTSLVSESDAPFIYTLLGDALLRLRDAEEAVSILEEAAAQWPDDAQVQLRLGTALAMAGRPGEAVAILDPYLARHPGDHERRFLLLRTIYEASAAGAAIRSPDEDRELFERHAAEYARTAGPQQALVEKWRSVFERR